VGGLVFLGTPLFVWYSHFGPKHHHLHRRSVLTEG
jgi:hypothetical protein